MLMKLTPVRNNRVSMKVFFLFKAINQDNLLRQLPSYIQYVPVFVQPQQQQAAEADPSTSRQFHAGAGFNLGPFG
jgi:hypothetical protein